MCCVSSPPRLKQNRLKACQEEMLLQTNPSVMIAHLGRCCLCVSHAFQELNLPKLVAERGRAGMPTSIRHLLPKIGVEKTCKRFAPHPKFLRQPGELTLTYFQAMQKWRATIVELDSNLDIAVQHCFTIN